MTTRQIMLLTLAALIPGAAALTFFFGAGILLNVIVAMLTALITDTLMLRLRDKPMASLTDGSTLLTGALLGLCLPPFLPLWLVVFGVAFALIFGKHLYGGTGNNVFNPAMVGYAMLIIAFPLAMSYWPGPGLLVDWRELLQSKLALSAGQPAFDGISAATPLDAYKFRGAETNQEFFAGIQQQNWTSWLWINLAFLAGGLYLCYQKIVPWRLPAAMLCSLGLLAAIFYDSGSSDSLGSPLFHLFTGATMMAAFFIITDPVTCPTYGHGLIVFGVGVAMISFIIRSIGAYPEGIAFAVLLMNACSPLIDQIMRQRAVPR